MEIFKKIDKGIELTEKELETMSNLSLKVMNEFENENNINFANHQDKRSQELFYLQFNIMRHFVGEQAFSLTIQKMLAQQQAV